MKPPIFQCLWFDYTAKEAAEFYCSVFKNSSITSDNSLVTVFESSGQKFMCMNGGPLFKFKPSISFYVVCVTKEQTDATWEKLLEGGSVLMPLNKYDWSARYGWLQDKYGINWQLSFSKMEEIGQKFTPALMFTGNLPVTSPKTNALLFLILNFFVQI